MFLSYKTLPGPSPLGPGILITPLPCRQPYSQDYGRQELVPYAIMYRGGRLRLGLCLPRPCLGLGLPLLKSPAIRHKLINIRRINIYYSTKPFSSAGTGH